MIIAVVCLGAGCSGSLSKPDVTPITVQDSAVTSTASSDLPSPPAPSPEEIPLPPVPVVVVWPLARAQERITKKSFGTYVTPKQSPVSPERFTGYHTGTDFEIFEGEKDTDVLVSAVCTGKLLRATTASGYGGYAVQACDINGAAVTVVYGHLRLSSITAKVGQTVEAGKAFAKLGTGYSTETDQERKHLHLSIHRGTVVNIRGYSATKAGLKDWIDFETVMK